MLVLLSPHLWLVEAREQCCNSGLAGAAAADKCCHGALLQHQVDVTQHCGAAGRNDQDTQLTYVEHACIGLMNWS